jgi:hypothetical protein
MKKILITMLLLSVFVVVSCDGGSECPSSDKFCHAHRGLLWSDSSSGEMGWEDAADYCLAKGGRLPTISELRKLIQDCPATEYPKPTYLHDNDWCGATDSCLSSSCRNKVCEGCVAGYSKGYSFFGHKGTYHSSSVLEKSNMQPWYVDFSAGNVSWGTSGLQLKTICVK